MPRKDLKVKRPSWKTDNSLKWLTKMGLIDVQYHDENERVAKVLRGCGFEYWDSCCIADYDWNFNGYTLTFRKKIAGEWNKQGSYLFFRWHWVAEMSIYWTGELGCMFDFTPEERSYHPWAHFEVNNITDRTLSNLPTYEVALVRALVDLYQWKSITLTT